MAATQSPVCLRTGTDTNAAKLKTYLKLGGYAELKRIVTEGVRPIEIINQVKLSGLRGRGGAGFPSFLEHPGS